MYPYPVRVFELHISVWNLTFLAGVVAAYPLWLRVLRLMRPDLRPHHLPVRWLVVVYVSALAAQIFAYLVDLNTRVVPPESVSWFRYYVDPLFGPKTLYGVILFLPLTALAVSLPWRDLRPSEVLDSLTPPLCAVLGVCRIGCFLQGCCYGVPSRLFGISFPAAGAVYSHQLAAGLIAVGEPPLPVVPTQILEAVALFALCVWSTRALARGKAGIFLPLVASYSAFRFLIEWVRDDAERNFLGPLSSSQWVALAVLGAYGLWKGAVAR